MFGLYLLCESEELEVISWYAVCEKGLLSQYTLSQNPRIAYVREMEARDVDEVFTK